jgi:hypothetical protein
MKRAFLLLFAVCLAACGPKTLSTVRDTKKDDKSARCPSDARAPTEEISLLFSGAVPARIAVDVEGERRYSECVAAPVKNPVVQADRYADHRLVLNIQHFDFSRPKTLAYAVKELVDCGEKENDIVPLNVIPISHVTEYPDGTKCAGQPVARILLEVR